MDCSIIIPTFNTSAITLRCLRNLKQEPPRVSHEIIVVDNHSSDDTVAAIAQEFPEVLLFQNPANLGFSKACNCGSRFARGKFLCFLNSDTEHAGPAIDRLTRWLDQYPKTGIVGPDLRAADNTLIQMSWGWNPILVGEFIQQYMAPYSLRKSAFKRRVVAWLQRKSRHVSIICGACLMIRRSTFDAIQGFDEDFELYFEDSDLCYRGHKNGWDIDFVSEAKITHHLGQSTKGEWTATSLIYQQSHLEYYRKHGPRWSVYLLKLYLLLKWLRLRKVAWREPEGRDKSIPYCRAYLRVILGKTKITLEEGIPQ